MSNHRSTVNEIVARCRRVGWDVEMSDQGGTDWLFKIHCPPPHRPAYIHGSPSDVNWSRTLMRQLNAAGFAEAEKAHLVKAEAERKEKLASQRAQADDRAAKLARRAKEAEALTSAAGKYAGPQEVDIAWLTTPTPWPETRTVVMTPEAAKHLLKMNTANRKRSEARVQFFEELIRTDQFRCTHQGGASDSNGIVQDGQSRLEAIVNLGKPLVMQWSVGMPPENFAALDAGGPRTARDVAFIMGELDPGAVAAAARIAWIIDEHGHNAYRKSKYRMSNDRVAKAIREYGEGLGQAIGRAKDIRKEVKRAGLASLSAAIFLLDRQLPAGDPRVDRFLEDLKWGIGGRSGAVDPVYKLRKALTDGPSDKRRHYDAYEQVALFNKAWNLRAVGERRHNLVWKRNTDFPVAILPPPIDDDTHWAALLEASA